MKMRLDFRLKLILLVLVVISNVHFKCQALVEASSQQKQQQPLRQIGPQAGKNSSSVERLAAILSAKPRPGSATQVASQQQQQQQQAAPSLSNAKKVVYQPVRLHSEASTLYARSVSNLTAATVGGKPAANGAKNQGKRQAGEFGVGDPVAHRLSRRNEDPWFLDQAPLPLQPYRFNYNVKDKNGLTEQYRQETGDGKFLTGSYGYVLPDGIFRHVDYVADDRGFRAFIRTSEPGTANQNPADVVINSSPVAGSLGYVSPALVSSNFINSQPSLLLGGQQQQQQQQQQQAQPTPQLNWADQQQQQLPRAAWNYSTLGPSQFNPLSDRFKTNLDGSGVLARRAPGSIVGTPLRNFSSFAYPLQTPSVDLGPATSSYLTSQDPSNTSSFQSLSHFGDLARLKPISSGSTSWLSNNLTKLNAIGGDAQFQTHLTDSKTDRGRDRPPGGEPTSGGLSPGVLQDTGARYGSVQELRPAPNLSFAQPTFHYQRPGLLLASRVGPDVLLYDRPFGVQQVAGGSNKLAYDYNHVLVRDSAVPYLAEERARSLAYLEQLKALSRNIARPDLATNELATLSPFGELTPRPPASGRSGQTSSGSIGGETTTKATSSSHSEQHHEHKSTTSQVVDDMSRLTVTKEHKSGSSSGSGHDLGTSSRQPSGGGTDAQLLTPPPQPQFSRGGGGTNQQRWATKGQQQQLARLLAPYADEHQFGGKGGVKGGHDQQFSYDHRGQQPSTKAPAAPDEPRAPVEPIQPAGDPDQTRQTGTSTTRTTPADEIDLNLATASKSTPQTMRPANEQQQQQHHQARSVRMPDDYRTSMLMNDLRSMQNALGLPQPPRLQRSSSLDGEHRSSNSLSFGPANLAEQIVAARMHRVETLLSGGGSSNQPVAPQQASVQRSVAVRADKLEDKNQLQEDRSKLDKISLLAMLNKPLENEVDDDQPRRLSTGPVLKQLGGQQHQQQHSSGSGQANETSMFEAQRLNNNNNNRARLRAEKVSELEKFQQRLRTQQLLLEHVKSNESKANSSASPRQPMHKTLANNLARVNEANSHVKYDEPQENEQLSTIGKLAVVSSGGAAAESGEPARLRRQNDVETAGNRTRASLLKVTTEEPTSKINNQPKAFETTRAPAASEFARQLHQWPSISNGLERQRSNNSTSNSDTNSSTSGSVGLKAHKMDSHKQDGAATTSSTNGTHQRDASPNTINLDFINSVTALSMDHLNPFAISSVNPAIQRTSGANSERLSPHRLAMPLASVQQQQQQQQTDQQSTGGANLLATAPARYFSSPELLAALDHHERHDTGQRMRALLGSNQLGPSNHRSSGSGVASTGTNAPYMMQPQEQVATPVRSLDGILGAKFIVAPTTSSTSLMSEAANSQHKSVVPTPRPSSELGLRQARISSRTIDSAIQRDGFEIRDRQVQADNHRFYEVVSSLKQPTEMSASFQAYRGKFS